MWKPILASELYDNRQWGWIWPGGHSLLTLGMEQHLVILTPTLSSPYCDSYFLGKETEKSKLSNTPST